MKSPGADRRLSSSLWVIIGLLGLGTAGLLLVMVALGATPAAGTPTPSATAAAASATPEASPTPSSATPEGVLVAGTAVRDLSTSTPAPRPEVPDDAPDFTLERAGGGSFTLTKQLEQGPVVLVFFQRCG